MKAWLALAALTGVVACSDPELKKCETQIKATLKAPSTYKLISYDKKSHALEYDAANPMGVPLRMRGDCLYGSWFPKADTPSE